MAGVISFDYETLSNAYETFTGPMDMVMSDLTKSSAYLEEMAKGVGSAKFLKTVESLNGVFDELKESFVSIKGLMGELVSYAKKLSEGVN